MGGIASAIKNDIQQNTFGTNVERDVFRRVVDAMNEYELEQYYEHRPSIPRLWLYYLQNIMCLIELPLHWLYHLVFCIVTIILLIPFLIFRCFCVRDNDLPNGSRDRDEDEDICEPCVHVDCCDYCFNFKQLHDTSEDIAPRGLAAPPRDDVEVGVAEAVKLDKGEEGVGVASAVAPIATAQEHVDPGCYLSLLRVLEHHDYLLKAYGAMFFVLTWNLIAPLYSCTCEYMVTYLSEEYYFIPLERPQRPKVTTSGGGACCGGDDDCCKCDESDCCARGSSSAVDMIDIFMCCCPWCDTSCCRTFCVHDLVHCDTYAETYDYRVRQNKPKSERQTEREFLADRASAVGIGRRNPERFVRSLFITFSGLSGFHPAKNCGPMCRSQFEDYSSRAQKWHNEMQEKSKVETKKFFQETFGFDSYEELLAHERGPSTGEAITQATRKVKLGIAPRVQQAMSRVSKKKADV